MLITLYGKKLVLPATIGGLVFFIHFLRLSESPYPSGWDAYFYLVQVKAMVEEGAMHSPDSSPVYLLLKWFYWAYGDLEQAFQLLCAGLAGVFSALVTGLCGKLSPLRIVSLAAGLFCLASPSLAFFAANFPKNLLGIDFFLLVVLFATHKRFTGKWLSVVFAIISHRMTAVLSIAFLAFQRLRWSHLLLPIAGIALLTGVSQLFPGMLHLTDLERFEGQFSFYPQVSHYSFTKLLDLDHQAPVWSAEIWFSLLIWVGAVLHWMFRPGPFHPHFPIYRGLILISLLLFFPLLEINVTSLGYRLFVTGMLLTPVFLTPLLANGRLLFQSLIVLTLAIGCIFSYLSLDIKQFDPDYAKYEQIAQRTSNFLDGQSPELIISHKGLAEVITFKSGLDALPWQPEYEIDPGHLYRIVADIEAFEIEAVLNRPLTEQYRPLRLGYTLLLERDWQEFVQIVRADGQDEELMERIFQWKNPMEIRPAYLLRGKE